ncbi:MAG: hypothetical protein U0Y68_12750, partial [Blastocatellia bacterium]
QEHEVIWLLAIADAPSAVNAEAVQLLDEQLKDIPASLFASQTPGKPIPHIVRWAISKMGFTPDGTMALAQRSFAASDYLQMELLTHLLTNESALATPDNEVVIAAFPVTLEALPEVVTVASLPEEFTPEPELMPVEVAIASSPAEEITLPAAAAPTRDDVEQFELVIPTNDDQEILAARAVERMARSAGFSSEAVNQMKTALIEACLSLAAADQQPESRIYQRYQLDEEKMTIIVANTVAGLNDTTGTLVTDDPDRVWRLEVLRSLVDFVRLTKLTDGWRVELTRFIPVSDEK